MAETAAAPAAPASSPSPGAAAPNAGAHSAGPNPSAAAPTSPPRNGAAGPETPPASPPGDKPPPAWRPPPLKVYGETREVTAEQYHRYAQMAAAGEVSQKKLAEERKALEGWREKVRADPWSALGELGIDASQLDRHAATRLLEAEERLQETPEQREAREAKSELERLKKEKADAEEKQKQETVRQHRDTHFADMKKRYSEALTKVGIPEGFGAAFVMARMAHYEDNTPEGLEPPGAEQLAGLVLEDIRTEQKAAWGKLRGDALLDNLGEDMSLAVVNAYVERVERQRAAEAPPPIQKPAANRNPANGQFTPTPVPTRERVEFERILTGQG